MKGEAVGARMGQNSTYSQPCLGGSRAQPETQRASSMSSTSGQPKALLPLPLAARKVSWSHTCSPTLSFSSCLFLFMSSFSSCLPSCLIHSPAPLQCQWVMSLPTLRDEMCQTERPRSSCPRSVFLPSLSTSATGTPSLLENVTFFLLRPISQHVLWSTSYHCSKGPPGSSPSLWPPGSDGPFTPAGRQTLVFHLKQVNRGDPWTSHLPWDPLPSIPFIVALPHHPLSPLPQLSGFSLRKACQGHQWLLCH